MNTTVRIKFSGTEGETYKHVEKIAGEYGFNYFYRDKFAEKWPSMVNPGVTIFEDFFYRWVGDKKETLHIITENAREKEKQDRATRELTINND